MQRCMTAITNYWAKALTSTLISLIGSIKEPVEYFAVGVGEEQLTFAGIRLSSDSRPPRQVVVEVLALLAVLSFGVVRALTFAVNHLWYHLPVPGAGSKTPAGVAVTRATSTNDHVVYGVVILLLNLVPVVEQIIAERVKPREVDSQVGYLQEVLHVFAVRIFNRKIRRKNSEYDLPEVKRNLE